MSLFFFKPKTKEKTNYFVFWDSKPNQIAFGLVWSKKQTKNFLGPIICSVGGKWVVKTITVFASKPNQDYGLKFGQSPAII